MIASLDSSSGALSKIGYLPYGKSASASGPFGYTGQRIDTETNGLYYYRARHYSPVWGRFLQTDPIGYSGGSNLYAYVSNNPLNLVDSNGLIADAINRSLQQKRRSSRRASALHSLSLTMMLLRNWHGKLSRRLPFNRAAAQILRPLRAAKPLTPTRPPPRIP